MTVLPGVLRRTPSDAVTNPAELRRFPAPDAQPLDVPRFSTVAEALLHAHRIDPAHSDPNLDSQDWWWSATLAPSDVPQWLTTDGLSVGAEVFVADVRVHHSKSAWLPVSVPIPGGATRLDICFRSLDAQLAALQDVDRAYRARWRTRLVSEQRLRLVRTPLLGRMSGWNLPLPIIGIHSPMQISLIRAPEVHAMRVVVADDGSASVEATLLIDTSGSDSAGRPVVLFGGQRHSLQFVEAFHDGRSVFRFVATVANAPRWWPHTHGEPNVVPMSISHRGQEFVLPSVSFRHVEVDHGDVVAGRTASITVNGVKVFVRGVNWIPLDVANPSLAMVG